MRTLAPRPSKFRDEYYVTVYRLSRQGLGKARVAAALGIPRMTLDRWLARFPALKSAYLAGKEDRGPAADTFSHYVFNRLPPAARKLWAKLTKAHTSGGAADRVRKLLAGRGKEIRQHLWVHAYVANNFNKSRACEVTGTSYHALEKWVRHDPAFAELLDGHLREARKDFVENAVMDLVAARHPAVTVFAAKSVLKDRGYAPEKTVRHEGAVDHRHGGSVTVTQVLERLPVADRVKLLEEMDNIAALPPHPGE
jgi:hypothetical protein